MSKLKAQLAQLRNILAEMHVVDLYPGAQLAMHKSNAQDLVDSGVGGILDVDFMLGLDPDGKHPYFEQLRASLNIDTDTLHIFSDFERAGDLDVTLSIRNTWPTPVFDVSNTYKLEAPRGCRDLVLKLSDIARAFARLHYRSLVGSLHSSGYFDATDWSCPVAVAFLEHLQVQTCQSTAA